MVGLNFGKRIKYIEHGKLLLSTKVYSDEYKYVRIILDTEEFTYKLVDPATGIVHVEGGKNINNLEVLQRNAKKALKELLNASFEKEKRAKPVVVDGK